MSNPKLIVTISLELHLSDSVKFISSNTVQMKNEGQKIYMIISHHGWIPNWQKQAEVLISSCILDKSSSPLFFFIFYLPVHFITTH